jgi:hypothetical protein
MAGSTVIWMSVNTVRGSSRRASSPFSMMDMEGAAISARTKLLVMLPLHEASKTAASSRIIVAEGARMAAEAECAQPHWSPLFTRNGFVCGG